MGSPTDPLLLVRDPAEAPWPPGRMHRPPAAIGGAAPKQTRLAARSVVGDGATRRGRRPALSAGGQKSRHRVAALKEGLVGEPWGSPTVRPSRAARSRSRAARR